MAYVGSTLVLLAESIEGTNNLFSYKTSDVGATVLSAGYFSDGAERGMQLGDLVFIYAAGVGFLAYVSLISGFACSLAAVSIALINGNALPTSNPGPGSGLLWNNGSFVCVA